MNFKKIVAAVAAAAVAVSMVAVNVFAAKSETINTLKLNSADEDGKVIQWPINTLVGIDAVNTITIKGVGAVGEGWCGGGGAIGYESVAGWKQVDFALDGANVTLDAATGAFTAELTFTGDAPAVDPGEGIIQLGWWWGSGDGTMEITDVLVNGSTIIGLSGTFVEPAEETAEEATEETTEAAEEEAAVEEEAAEEETAEEVVEEEIVEEVEEEVVEEVVEEAPAADTTTEATETGNVAVASIAAVMALAGAAAVVAKKRN